MRTAIEFEFENGKKLKLSVDNARELYLKLSEYFGYNWRIEPNPYPSYPVDPYTLNPYPIITNYGESNG